MKFDTLKLKGHAIEVNVDSSGMFYASLEGHRYSAPTFANLRQKLGTAIRQRGAKISIPFAKVDETGVAICRGFLVGIHGSNHNLLVQWESGPGDLTGSSQMSTWECHGFVPPEFGDELLRLTRAKNEAEAALNNFTEEHSINGRKAVEEALARAGVEAES